MQNYCNEGRMLEMLVIADDITGALDTGVQFAKSGIFTAIVRNDKFDESNNDKNVRILVIDAETRHLDSDEAYKINYNIAKSAMDNGVKIIFKKIDSTFRGQIGSELSAIVDASGGGELALVPAFPMAGRTTKNGVHFIFDEPIHSSDLNKDPFDPVRHSRISEIIHEQSDVDVICVPIDEVAPSLDDNNRITVYDAQTDDDMFKIANSLYNNNQKLLAGCAGLAVPYSQLMKESNTNSSLLKKTNGMLIACGSLNPVTEAQILYAQERGFHRITIPIKESLGKNYLKSDEGVAFIEKLHKVCLTGKPVILDTFDYKSSINVNEITVQTEKDNIRELISRRVGEIVKAWADFDLNQTLVITGGDMLFAFMEVIGCNSLVPIDEIETGVVCSKIMMDGNASLQIISKAGGYGSEDVFVKIAEKILTSSK